MDFPLIINIVAFVALLVLLNRIDNQSWSLSKRVLTGLVLGVIFWPSAANYLRRK